MTEKEEKKFKEEVERNFKMGYTKALMEEGYPASVIAKRLGASASTVRNWMKKLTD